MKSFSSSSFASENAIALELAAGAVKDDPYALFTNFQWFLLAGRDTVFRYKPSFSVPDEKQDT